MYYLNQQTLRTIEENIVQIIVKEFDANQDNLQSDNKDEKNAHDYTIKWYERVN